MQRDPAEKKEIRTVSRILPDGQIVELILDAETSATRLAVGRETGIEIVGDLVLESGERLVPVQSSNNLIKHSAVLLPASPEPYGAIAGLIAEIRAYIHRYVDLSEQFSRVASYYVLMTWVYDAFNELPYLRLRGDYGTGKTRALIVIGSLCYKAFFASGASTVSPIFHTLDTFGGTLIIDEADFRFSDEKSELVKILNNGNVRGFPVLRTAVTVKREFDPRAFNVFGPKIIAMRRAFDDQALESRFLTEEMGQRCLRDDIPINLPNAQKREALVLRNRLLAYRFENLRKVRIDESLIDTSLSPRLNQILVPLFSIIDDEILRQELRDTAQSFEQALHSERAASTEAFVLQILAELFANCEDKPVPVSALATEFDNRFGKEYDRPITPRYIGSILRRRLRLVTYKSHGVYVIPVSEKEKVIVLCRRYGVVNTDSQESITS